MLDEHPKQHIIRHSLLAGLDIIINLPQQMI